MKWITLNSYAKGSINLALNEYSLWIIDAIKSFKYFLANADFTGI